jgi:glyoxylase-like metal-dependent hydrolase (beta-lactamase superfamily II)
MTPDAPREIAPGITLVDTGYVRPRVAAAYIVRGARSAAIVETATSLCAPRILAALGTAGVAPEDVSHVIVTHVHLDHAGGAGALVRALPRAKLVVHPRGARHMVDPAKLVAGTTEVYGAEAFRRLYGEVVPVPAERVIEAPDGFTVDLGSRPLRVLDAPGHARHHFVLHDPASAGFFTGDAFGLSYRELDSAAGAFVFPTTTPVQFDPPALHATVDRMLAEKPARLYLTHYGMVTGDVPAVAAALHRNIDGHVRRARAAPSGPGRHEAIRAGLEAELRDELVRQRATLPPDEAVRLFAEDLDLNAQGLGVWLDASTTA